MSKRTVVAVAIAAAAFSTAVFAADAKKSPTLAEKTAAKPHAAADAGTGAADAGTAAPAAKPAPKK
jgi:hypothetical protein